MLCNSIRMFFFEGCIAAMCEVNANLTWELGYMYAINWGYWRTWNLILVMVVVHPFGLLMTQGSLNWVMRRIALPESSPLMAQCSRHGWLLWNLTDIDCVAFDEVDAIWKGGWFQGDVVCCVLTSGQCKGICGQWWPRAPSTEQWGEPPFRNHFFWLPQCPSPFFFSAFSFWLKRNLLMALLLNVHGYANTWLFLVLSDNLICNTTI